MRIIVYKLPLVLLAATALRGQSRPIPASAVLVLSPELCETQVKRGSAWTGKQTFKFGELFCPAAEKVAQASFSSYRRTESLPTSKLSADMIVLIPKLVDSSSTTTVSAFSKRKMVLLVEWTAKDSDGKLIWAQTVEGDMREKAGNLFTQKGHRRKMYQGVIDDLAGKSIAAIMGSKELRRAAASAPLGR